MKPKASGHPRTQLAVKMPVEQRGHLEAEQLMALMSKIKNVGLLRAFLAIP